MIEVARGSDFLHVHRKEKPSAVPADTRAVKKVRDEFSEGEGRQFMALAVATVKDAVGGGDAALNLSLTRALSLAVDLHRRFADSIAPPMRLANLLFAATARWTALTIASQRGKVAAPDSNSTVLDATMSSAGLLLREAKRLPVSLGDAENGRPLPEPLLLSQQNALYELSMRQGFAGTSPKAERKVPENPALIRAKPSPIFVAFLAHVCDRAALVVSQHSKASFEVERTELGRVLGFWTKYFHEKNGVDDNPAGLRPLLEAATARWVAARTEANVNLTNRNLLDIAMVLHGADPNVDAAFTLEFLRLEQAEKRTVRKPAPSLPAMPDPFTLEKDPQPPQGPATTPKFNAGNFITNYVQGKITFPDFAAGLELVRAVELQGDEADDVAKFIAEETKVDAHGKKIDVYGILKKAEALVAEFVADPTYVASIPRGFKLLKKLEPLASIPGFDPPLDPITVLRASKANPIAVQNLAVYAEIRAALKSEPAALEDKQVTHFLEQHRALVDAGAPGHTFDRVYVDCAAQLRKLKYPLPAIEELGQQAKRLVREEALAAHKKPGTWEKRLETAKLLDSHPHEALEVAETMKVAPGNVDLTVNLIKIAHRFSPDFDGTRSKGLPRAEAFELIAAADLERRLSAADIAKLLEWDEGPIAGSRRPRSDFVNNLLRISALRNQIGLANREEEVFGISRLLTRALEDCNPASTGKGIGRSIKHTDIILHMHDPKCGRRVLAVENRIFDGRPPFYANIRASFEPGALAGCFGLKSPSARSVAVIYESTVEGAISKFHRSAYPHDNRLVVFTKHCVDLNHIPVVLITGFGEEKSTDRLMLKLEAELLDNLAAYTVDGNVPNFVIRQGDGYTLLNLFTVSHGVVNKRDREALLRAVAK